VTVTPTFSICPRHGYLSGAHRFCPICDSEILSRKRQCAAASMEQPA
jgi:ribonucleoside-triphosphate reductase (formate)